MRAFRFSPSKVALGYIALSVLALALFALPLWFGFRANVGTFRAYVSGEEMQRLAQIFERDGAAALARAIESQARSAPRDQVVLFATPSKELLAGNLPAWPPEIPDAPGAYGLVISVGGGESMRVVASHVRLAGGYHLLMGRQSVRFESLVERFWYGIAGAVAIVLALGAAFAWLLRRTLLAEVSEISRTASAIVQGDFSRRLPDRGSSGELDGLARTVNGMLGQLARSQEQLEAQIAQRTAQLSASEERYALAMDASEEAHWDWIIPTDEYYAARSHFHIYGLPPDFQYSGRRQFLAAAPFHPEDRAKYTAAVSALFAGRESRLVMDMRLLLGGETRWVQIRGLCTRDASGVPVRYTGTVRDITDRKRLELALHESEERFALAVAGANDGIWDWDLTTRMIYMSPRAQEIIMGHGSDGVDVRHADEWAERYRLHPDDAPRREAALREHFRGGTPYYEGDWRVLHPDGTYHWVHSRGICTRDASGRAVRFAGSTTDIDARKRTEHALRRSRERYALAVEAAGEGHSDWNLETGEFYISPRLLEICGYPPGTTFEDRADWVARFPFHPEDRPKWEKAVAAHMAGRDSRFEMELRIVVARETRWVRFVNLCSRDAAGKPIRWTGSTTDITDRKSAAEALRLSEDRYARAMEGSDAGHWDWNIVTDEMFVSRRAREMLELPADTDRLPRTRAQIMALVPMHPDDRSAMHDIVEASLASGRHEREYRVIPRPGELRWLRSRAKVYCDARGTAVRMTGSLVDITERKLAADALRESEQRYERAMLAAEAGFWDWNVLTDEYHASPKLLEMAGFAPGTTFSSRAEHLQRAPFHPEDRDKWQRAVKELFAGTGQRLSMELRVIVNGQTRWQSLSGICVRDATGKVVRWTGSTTDITERKRAEVALRESEKRYERVMQASEDGFWEWVVATDEFYASPRMLALYGLPPDTVFRGRKDFLSRFPFHPEDLESWRKAVAAHLAGQIARVDLEVRAKWRGETQWIHLTAICLRDASGAEERWTGSVSDVTERRRAQDALKASEQRYSLAMEASEEGHFDVNLDTDEHFTSERLNEIHGFPPGTRTAKRSEYMKHVRFYGDDAEKYHAAIAAAEAKEGPERYEFEFRIVQPSGEVRWLRTRGKVTRDAEGRARRRIGVVADITERKLAEEALRLSEERYALAMEAAGDGHTDWNFVTGEFYISPRLLSILGYAPGTTFADRADWVRRFPFHPEDRPKWEAAVAAHLAGREAKFRMDLRIVVNGETRWVAFTFIASRDASGKPLRWTGSIADVNDAKLAADALRESEQRFRALTELSSDAYWAQDEDLRFVPTSWKYDLAGYPSDSNVGKTRWELSNATPLSGTWAEHEAVLRARKAFRDFEYRRVGPDGTVRYLSISGTPIFDEQGAFRGYQGVGRDITDRKRAEEELRDSEARFRALTELSSDWYWEQDENLRFTYLSNQALALTGYSGESSLGKTRWEIANMTPLSCTWAEHQALLAARQPFRDLECRRVGPDGAVRYLSMSGAPVFDEQGRFKGYQGIGRNITERKRAEEKLRESEALKSAMFETALDCIVSIDHEGRVVEFNPAAERTFGYRRAEALGKELAELIIPPRLRAQHRQGLARYLKSGEGPVLGRRTEMPAVRADGSEFPVELSVTRIATEGAPLFTAYLRDITERRRAEEKLRESEARFRSLTEISSDWYWRQDENLRFTYLSEGISERAGWPADVYLGSLRWEVPDIHPISCSWEEHKEVLAKREPFRDLEYWRPGKDGLISYSSISGAPIFDEQGRFKGYQGVGRNISERKRIEEELRSRQEMLELAQKSARAIAFEWRIGADGPDRNRWSPELAAMYGISPESYDGGFEQWKKLILPEDWRAVKEAIKHARRTGEVSAEYRVMHPDGSVHWLQAKGRMFFDAAGKPSRMVGFMHDVTERRQAEEELKRMERQLRQAQRLEAMGTLAGGIAHDFNNILGAILGYGEMALRDAPKASRLARDLDSIVVAGERGRALVDRVLAFSRSAVGERVPVHVEKVVREALDLISAKLPPHVTLHAKLRAGPAAMLGDATQVHQVVTNLASNAIQAMSAGGTLRVSLSAARLDAPRTPTLGLIAPGDYLILEVGDNGTGIAPEIVDRIFDPFFTTKEVGTGTGLGLSLVHGIVAEVNGAIDVASTPGKGSTFTVYLPRSGDALESLDKEEPELPRGDGQRVLIVDDEEPLVKLAARTLEELGYAPVGFTSSAAALAAFRADPQRFDAVITDERMPGMSGSALIREVRGIRDRIPIVLMSGFVGGAVAIRAREAGAEEVLKKPLSARDLATSLARVLHP